MITPPTPPPYHTQPTYTAKPPGRTVRWPITFFACVVTFVAGFILSRVVPSTAPPPAEDPCVAVQQAVKDESGRPSSREGTFDEVKWRTVGYLVVDNPECFSVAERAQFKALLDTMNQRGAG